MAQVTTEVALFNLALLGHLGQDPITAIGENSREGELTQVLYEPARDALLRSHPWNFAIKRAHLASDATVTPPFEYGNAFTLPSDCLKVLRTATEARCWPDDYRIEGRHLYSNSDAVSIEYTARETSVAKFDTLFVQLLSLDLAIAMCMTLADNASLLDRLTQKRDDLGRLAQIMDAQEGTPRDNDVPSWLYARL